MRYPESMLAAMFKGLGAEEGGAAQTLKLTIRLPPIWDATTAPTANIMRAPTCDPSRCTRI
jgi:hypothetical protein